MFLLLVLINTKEKLNYTDKTQDSIQVAKRTRDISSTRHYTMKI